MVTFDRLAAAYATLTEAIATGRDPVIQDAQASVKKELETLANSAGLKGPLKVDPKWSKAIGEQAASDRIRVRINCIAERITAAQSFQAANVDADLVALSELPAKKVKEVAGLMGHQISDTKSKAIVMSLLERLTGISSVLTDRSLVDSHVQKLQSLYERSVDSLPDKEIKAEIKDLRSLEIPVLARIAEEFGLSNPGKKRPDILKRIENKITATYKATMANRV